MEKRQEEERIRMENILSGNPLLNYSSGAPKTELKVLELFVTLVFINFILKQLKLMLLLFFRLKDAGMTMLCLKTVPVLNLKRNQILSSTIR